jgi:predicted ATPase
MISPSLYGDRIKNITIKNFGPIKEGKIELKSLTILIGANNSGKSYAATLIYALNKAISSTAFYPNFGDFIIPNHRKNPISEIIIKTISNYFNGLNAPVTENTFEFKIDSDEINKARTQELKNIEKRVNDLISREFGANIGDLKNDGKNNFQIRVETMHHSFSIENTGNKIKLTDLDPWKKSIVVKLHSTTKGDDHEEIRPTKPFTFSESLDSIKFNLELPFDIIFSNEKHVRNRVFDSFMYKILEVTIFQILGNTTRKPLDNETEEFYYLPAARSGILQGHTALAAAWIRLIPSTAGVSDMKIERFSGVVADFLSNIIDFGRKKKPLFDVAENFEKEIINGHIVLTFQHDTSNQVIEYEFKNMRIPINRSSSTVSELSPIFLFLKYTLNKGDTIIIEEPEAHLHVANQRVLARLIVSMIRNGLKVLITSHSETLLEEINNLIILKSLPDKVKKEENIGTELYLDTNELSVLNFVYNSNGTSITPLLIDKIEGIPHDEFMRVHEKLYDESTKLRHIVDSLEGENT